MDEQTLLQQFEMLNRYGDTPHQPDEFCGEWKMLLAFIDLWIGYREAFPVSGPGSAEEWRRVREDLVAMSDEARRISEEENCDMVAKA